MEIIKLCAEESHEVISKMNQHCQFVSSKIMEYRYPVTYMIIEYDTLNI